MCEGIKRIKFVYVYVYMSLNIHAHVRVCTRERGTWIDRKEDEKMTVVWERHNTYTHAHLHTHNEQNIHTHI